MPMKTGKSLLAKYAGKVNKALAEAAEQEATERGGARLPPNIVNGVIQLRECEFRISDGEKPFKNNHKGEVYLHAMAVIVEPDEVEYNGKTVKVSGQQTRLFPVFCCDTKSKDGKVTSSEKNFLDIQNRLKLMGAEGDGVCDTDSIEETAKALEAAQPYLRFGTRPRKDMQTGEVTGAWEDWGKCIPDYQSNGDGGVEDNTEETETEASEEGDDSSESTTTEGEDLDSLAEKADSNSGPEDDDEGSSERLKELALEAGIAQKKIDKADNWAQVVEWIREASPPQEPEQQEEEAAEWKPEKEQVVLFQAAGAKKASQHEILSVNVKAMTLTLKDLITGKTVLGKDKKPLSVAWDKVSVED